MLWLWEYLDLKARENPLFLTLFLGVILQAVMGDVQMEYTELIIKFKMAVCLSKAF